MARSWYAVQVVVPCHMSMTVLQSAKMLTCWGSFAAMIHMSLCYCHDIAFVVGVCAAVEVHAVAVADDAAKYETPGATVFLLSIVGRARAVCIRIVSVVAIGGRVEGASRRRVQVVAEDIMLHGRCWCCLYHRLQAAGVDEVALGVELSV
eukprot:808701-Pyramimonas_sp.AAC.1